MRSLSLGQAILIVALCAMLALVVVGIVWVSDATNGVDDVAMDENGWIALGLGSFFSLAIGCGLMALMFFSSRRGYDELQIHFENGAEIEHEVYRDVSEPHVWQFALCPRAEQFGRVGSGTNNDQFVERAGYRGHERQRHHPYQPGQQLRQQCGGWDQSRQGSDKPTSDEQRHVRLIRAGQRQVARRRRRTSGRGSSRVLHPDTGSPVSPS